MSSISDEYGQDVKLWIQFRSGEKNALGLLFNLYYDDLYAYGMKLTRNEELVRDSIQDLFVKLWESRNRVRIVKQVKPYLIISFRNLAIDLSRVAKRNPVQSFSISDCPELLIFDPEDFNTDGQFSQDQKTKLIVALNELSPRVREAIYLRFFMGLSSEELSTAMNVTIQSTRNLIYQGINSLKKELLILVFISEYSFFLNL